LRQHDETVMESESFDKILAKAESALPSHATLPEAA